MGNLPKAQCAWWGAPERETAVGSELLGAQAPVMVAPQPSPLTDEVVIASEAAAEGDPSAEASLPSVTRGSPGCSWHVWPPVPAQPHAHVLRRSPASPPVLGAAPPEPPCLPAGDCCGDLALPVRGEGGRGGPEP